MTAASLLGQYKKGTRYEMKFVGDSPEICRGLDAYGYSDFKRSTGAFAFVLDINDSKRFGFGFPKEVWDTMDGARHWNLYLLAQSLILTLEMCLTS